jgi:hypothetical protein
MMDERVAADAGRGSGEGGAVAAEAELRPASPSPLAPPAAAASADALVPMTMAPRLADVGRYQGPAHAAPYAMSRMAPAFDLVNAAEEIQKADAMVATMTGGKLSVLAEQMRAIRAQAARILERARRDADLHRARCNFEKKAGAVYHLYRRNDDGELWFSLMGPTEWSRPQPQAFEGTYRLEADMSYTRLDVPDDGAPADPEAVRALLLGPAR